MCIVRTTETVHVVQIHIYTNTRPVIKIGRIIAPIVWRNVASVGRSPKSCIDYGRCYVNRFYDIILTIYVWVSHNLHAYALGGRFLIYKNGRHILIQIFGQYGLYNNHVHIVFHGLYHTQVIHLSIAVQIQIGNLCIFAVDSGFKICQIFRFAKNIRNAIKIQIVADIFIVHCHRNRRLGRSYAK